MQAWPDQKGGKDELVVFRILLSMVDRSDHIGGNETAEGDRYTPPV